MKKPMKKLFGSMMAVMLVLGMAGLGHAAFLDPGDVMRAVVQYTSTGSLVGTEVLTDLGTLSSLTTMATDGTVHTLGDGSNAFTNYSGAVSSLTYVAYFVVQPNAGSYGAWVSSPQGGAAPKSPSTGGFSSLTGAYSIISASNAYTAELTKGGYFVEGTVKPLTSNYVIVILPAGNPGNIQSLADLGKPGLKIAMEDKSVPAGTATIAALANLAKSTYSKDWNQSIFNNVVTYETSEPGVATKVQLGEVDAGFVYESTYTAAPKGTYQAISIPKKDNYLQTYTIGVLKGSQNKGAASDFENFMVSAAGQQDLLQYGFRPISTT